MTGTTTLRIVTALLSLSLLAACVDRSQADRMLAKGCAAGVNALAESDGQQLADIKNSAFTFVTNDGEQMRHVTLSAGTKDYPDTVASYECTFQEDFGIMNTSYAASLYQVKAGDKTVGKSGGQISGDMQDFIKLEDAVKGALHGG